MTTRVKADRSLCDGFAHCVMDAPAYFDLDDDGKVVVLRSDVAEADRADVEAAVEECPMAALRLEEEDD